MYIYLRIVLPIAFAISGFLVSAPALFAQGFEVDYYVKHGFDEDQDLSKMPPGMVEGYSRSAEKVTHLYELHTTSTRSSFRYVSITADSDTTGAHLTYPPYDVWWGGSNTITLQPSLGPLPIPCVERRRLTAENWNITGEKGPIICGEPTFEARSRVTGDTIVYFAPGLPTPSGPDGLGGLPGLILKVRYVQRYYEATSIRRFQEWPASLKIRPCANQLKDYKALQDWLFRKKSYSTP